MNNVNGLAGIHSAEASVIMAPEVRRARPSEVITEATNIEITFISPDIIIFPPFF